MKLMNTVEFTSSLKELVISLGKEFQDYSVSFRQDTSREEKNGSLTYVFVVKNKKNQKAKEYKVALYIFENRKSIESFIINGRTLALLFENSTINSPSIAAHYLQDIIKSEIKFAADLEAELEKKKAAKKKPYNANGKSSYTKRTPGKYPKQNNGHKPYNKPYSKNGSSRDYKRNSNNNHSQQKSYPDFGKGRPTNGTAYGERRSVGINIKTTKNPYENSRGGNR